MAKSETLPPVTPELERRIARKIHKLTPEQWEALPVTERKAKIVEARSVLKSERNFFEEQAKAK